MFIGTSLGKCLKDILDGRVKEDDVFVIVTNTMCPTLDRLMAVVDEYYYDGNSRGHAYDLSAHTLEDAQTLAQRLFESGKLHQPRCFKDDWRRRGHSQGDTWLEIVPTLLSDNPSVVDAYGKYRMLANLTR